MSNIFSEPSLQSSIPSTVSLATSPLYNLVDKNQDISVRAQVVYDRARAISRAYGELLYFFSV